MTAFNRGDIALAEALIADTLSAQANHFDALQLKAVIAAQRGDSDAAQNDFERLLALRPDHEDSYCNLCAMLCTQRRFTEAEAVCRRALARELTFPKVLQSLTAVLQALGDLPALEHTYVQLLELDPGNALARRGQYVTLSQLGRTTEAEAKCRRHLSTDPTAPGIRIDLAQILVQQGRISEALDEARVGVNLNPDAEAAYRLLGELLHGQDQLEEAAAAYTNACSLAPKRSANFNALANVLYDQRHLDAAHAAYHQSIELDPAHAVAFANLGNLLRDQGRLNDAEHAFRQSLISDPSQPAVRQNLALLELFQGQFETGWQSYEWRKRVIPHGADAGTKSGTQPQSHRQGAKQVATGHSTLFEYADDPRMLTSLAGVAGKHVAVLPEQGLGDYFQFIRYAPLLQARGARVSAVCWDRISAVIRTMRGLESVRTRLYENGVYDHLVYVASLPGLFSTRDHNIPAAVPYVSANDGFREQYRARYQQRFDGQPIVGLSWAGGANPLRRRLRSIPLMQFAGVLGTPGVGFVSLQYGEDVQAEVAKLPADLQARLYLDRSIDPLGDLEPYTAQIAACDLIISVDNTAVHIAGALGQPVWTLLPKAPDWRWMAAREDSPWYPSMRLIRQREEGDWTDVLNAVQQDLQRSYSITC